MFNPLRFVARGLLGAVFIGGGMNQLKATAALAPLVDDAAKDLGLSLPTPAENLIKVNGTGMITAGTALALGIAPRTAAAALIGMLVPTTLAGHPFWKSENAEEKMHQTSAFMSNAAIAGGLLMVIAERRKCRN